MTNDMSFVIVLLSGNQLLRVAVSKEIDEKLNDAVEYYQEPDSKEYLMSLLKKDMQDMKIVEVYEIFDVIVL